MTKLGFCPPLSLASVQEQRLPNAASVDAEDTPPITPTTAQHSKVTAPLVPLARSLARSLLYLSISLYLYLSLSISTFYRDPILPPISRSDFFFAVAIPIKRAYSRKVPRYPLHEVSPRVLLDSILVSRLNIRIHVLPFFRPPLPRGRRKRRIGKTSREDGGTPRESTNR